MEPWQSSAAVCIPAHRRPSRAGSFSLLICAALLTFSIGGTPARAGVTPTPFLVFDVLQATASGPAYPTQPVRFDVGAPQFPPDPIIPIEILALSLRSVDPVTLPIDVGAGTGPTQQQAIVNFTLGATAGDLPAQSFFDVFFDVGQHPGSGASVVMGVNPQPFIPADSSFFDVFFEIALEDIGTVKHTAHFETLLPLAFSRVNVTPPQSPAFGTSFTLDRVAGANLDPRLPLFSVTVTGSFAPVPEPGTLALLGIGLAGVAARRRR